MTRTTRLLLLALLLVAAAAALFFRQRESARALPPRPAPSAAAHKMSPAFAAEYEKVRAADRTADVGERCLSYPDPDWLQWDRDVIKAFCRSRSFKHLTIDDIKTALDENHPERLQAAFAGYLSDNYSDPEKRGILTRVYREVFSSSATEVRDVVKRWANADPMSAFALAARGTYYKSAAETSRGSGYARDTPSESFESMEKLAARARRDLEDSLRMSPKLMAAYDSLISLGMITSDHELIAKSVDAALALDPADERIYLDWMQASQPRWGGSLDAMSHIADLATQHAAANPMLKLVAEKKIAQYGDIELARDNYGAALERYEAAFKIAPSTIDLGSAAFAASRMGQHEKAIWYYSQAYRFDQFNGDALSRRAFELNLLQRPDLAAESIALAAPLKMATADGLVSQGNAYWDIGRFEDAAKAYQAALKLNAREEQALTGLAGLEAGPLKSPANAEPYVEALQRYYPDHARTWLLVAQAAQDDDARCVAALERYLSLANPDDPNERANIGAAKAALAKHHAEGTRK